jgi:hypothetical protein
LRFTELTLNLVWAIIAVASYALLFRYLASRRTKQARAPSRLQCVVALTCLLSILFPVISLSDDLHEMQATLEEASPSVLVKKKCVVNHVSNQVRISHQVPFVLASLVTSIDWADLGYVAAQKITRSSSGLRLAELGRSPPSFAVSQIS